MKHHRTCLFVFTLIGVVAAFAGILLCHNYVSCSGDSSFPAEFNDGQARHIAAAMKYGLREAPLKDRQSVMRVAGLEHLKSCRFYKVNKMRYGMPYLTPSAKEELASLAKDFQKGRSSKSLPRARLIVTSALRTEEDVQDLRKVNLNAVENSAHLYGTTFDISWAHYQSFNKKADGKDYLYVLADVLRKHRKDEKIYIRYETREQCFHITVRK